MLSLSVLRFASLYTCMRRGLGLIGPPHLTADGDDGVGVAVQLDFVEDARPCCNNQQSFFFVPELVFSLSSKRGECRQTPSDDACVYVHDGEIDL